MVSEAEFLASFQTIKQLNNQAFQTVDEAVRCEENEKPLEALDKYKNGIEIIDAALATPVGLPDNVNSIQEQWNEACKMIHKMKRARAEVIQRIGTLSQKHIIETPKAGSSTQKQNDNNDEASNILIENEKGRPRTYTELAQALREMQYNESTEPNLELMFQCTGVKLYNIKPHGIVSTTSDNSTMRIIRLEKDETKNLQTTFFIQIIKTSNTVPIISNDLSESESPSPTSSFCIISHPDEPKDNFDAKDDSSWIYPLIPGVSPCFRTQYGAFIFPDLEALEEGTSFGIIIPTEDDSDSIVLDLLEAILHGVVIETIEVKEPRDLSVKVSENIVKGAQFLSTNIVQGAEKAGEFMTYSTPYLISKIEKAPSNGPKVSEGVQTTVQVVKSASGVAATVTGYIAGKVCSSTMALGRFLAPHIQKHGSTLLSKGFGLTEEDASEKMTGVLTIAAGAVEGFSTVYAGLEDSAKILGKNLSNNSVKIIEHKYGSSAGSVALGTFDTVGNVINVSQNVTYFTPKGLAKRTAKNAGKAFVEDYRPNLRNGSGSNYIPASSIYPNLTALETAVKK